MFIDSMQMDDPRPLRGKDLGCMAVPPARVRHAEPVPGCPHGAGTPRPGRMPPWVGDATPWPDAPMEAGRHALAGFPMEPGRHALAGWPHGCGTPRPGRMAPWSRDATPWPDGPMEAGRWGATCRTRTRMPPWSRDDGPCSSIPCRWMIPVPFGARIWGAWRSHQPGFGMPNPYPDAPMEAGRHALAGCPHGWGTPRPGRMPPWRRDATPWPDSPWSRDATPWPDGPMEAGRWGVARPPLAGMMGYVGSFGQC